MKDIPEEWYYADSLGNYTFVFPFEAHWSRRHTIEWVRRNWFLSVWASIAYVVIILIGERLMRYKAKPFELRGALTAWNATLAVFSILGFARTSPEFFRTLTRHGFVHSVCQSTYTQDIVYDFWLVAFVGSKFVELFDTAFVVLRRRPLTFLHSYHHITVLVYCWHGGKELTAAGRWFCWMNYGVHSVMYTYYTIRATGRRLPRPISISVTSLQLTQMLMGCCIVYTVYTTKSEAWNAGLDADLACRQSWENLNFCFAIYVSYFLLFLHFFVRAYILPSKSSRVSKTTKLLNGNAPMKTDDRDAGNLKINRSRSIDEHWPSCEKDEMDDSNSELRRRTSRRRKGETEIRRMQLVLRQYYDHNKQTCENVLAYSTANG